MSGFIGGGSGGGGGSGNPGGAVNSVQYNVGGTSFGGVGPLTNGQLLIGSTGNPPVAAALTAGSGITITPAAGAITIAATASGGNVTGSGLTAHAVIVGAGTTNIAALASTGSANQIFISNGTTLDPSWTTTLPTAAFPALTGDVTTSAGSLTTTLASVITAGGPTGNTTTVPVITWDAKGRLTAVSTASIAFPVTSVSGTGAISVSPTTGAPVVSVATATASALGVVSVDNSSIAVTGGGQISVKAIVSDTSALGDILFTNMAAPVTPTAGSTRVYIDSTSGAFVAKNSIETSNTVVASSAGANQFATGINAAGVISYAQPSVSNLSGLPVTVAQGGTGQTSLTAHGILLGEGTSGIGVTAVGTANQILIGQASADPVWTSTLPTAAVPAFSGGQITSAGGSLALNVGTNALTLSNFPQTSSPSVLGAPVGTATPTNPAYLTQTQITALINNFSSTLAGDVPASGGGTTNFLRADGSWAAPTGGGNVTTGTMTTNGAVYANGTTSIASTAALTNGQILIGSTGVAPVAATITAGTAIGVSNGAGTITINNTGVTSAVAGTGIAVSGATGAVTVSLSTPVSVANGGSGAATLTAHGILLGEGTSAIAATAVGTTNQILIGQTGADPIWTNTLPGAAFPALTGDVTTTAGSLATTIANSAVTNAKLANMPANTIKGNNTAGSAAPIDLTQAQFTAMINNFTSALAGDVPASGGGTTNFLRADGSWAAPSGGGNVSTTTMTTNGAVYASGATAVLSTAALASGQIMIGTGSAPTTAGFDGSTLTFAGGTIAVSKFIQAATAGFGAI